MSGNIPDNLPALRSELEASKQRLKELNRKVDESIGERANVRNWITDLEIALEKKLNESIGERYADQFIVPVPRDPTSHSQVRIGKLDWLEQYHGAGYVGMDFTQKVPGHETSAAILRRRIALLVNAAVEEKLAEVKVAWADHLSQWKQTLNKHTPSVQRMNKVLGLK
jgi:uncharacterized membrane-anchored protein